jgi:hypothetical protein
MPYLSPVEILTLVQRTFNLPRKPFLEAQGYPGVRHSNARKNGCTLLTINLFDVHSQQRRRPCQCERLFGSSPADLPGRKSEGGIQESLTWVTKGIISRRVSVSQGDQQVSRQSLMHVHP